MGPPRQAPFALGQMERSQLCVNWLYLVNRARLYLWMLFYTTLMFVTVMLKELGGCERSIS